MKSRKILSVFCMVFCFAMLSVSCSDDDNKTGNGLENIKPDMSTKINNSVYGFVTNENDDPIAGATVASGDKTTTSDEDGYFEITDASVVKEYGVVSVEALGYFKGIRTWVSETDKKQFVRIKLLPKTIAGTFKSTDGGEVKLNNGLKLTFPANAIVDKASNEAYNGNVSVALQWLNPMNETSTSEMPGDLRATNSEGYLRSLDPFGVVAAELYGDAGQELQIADGKSVTVRTPIDSEQQSKAPGTISLWLFDDNKGLWTEEGEAQKEGNEYVSKIPHFSRWGWGVPYKVAYFSGRFVDGDNNPIVGHRIYTSWANGAAYTDANGYFCIYVAVQSNSATLNLAGDCILYSRDVNMTQGNQNLGTMTISGSNLTANVTKLSGTVVNCSDQPVAMGHVVYYTGKNRYIFDVNNGSYTSNIYFCEAINNMEIKAYDYNTGKNGTAYVDLSSTQANIAVDPIRACDAISEGDGYITFQMDGKKYTIMAHANSTNTYFWYLNGGTNMHFGEGAVHIEWWHNGGNAAGTYSGLEMNVFIDDIKYSTYSSSATMSIVYSKYSVTGFHNYDVEATFSATGLKQENGSRTVNITGGKLVFKGESFPF